MKLIIYPAHFGEPSASPFCVKVMMMLKVAGLDYTVDETTDPRKAPKKKLPVLQDDDRTIADSDHIRDYVEHHYGFDFDAGLSKEQRALSRAIIRMVEEHLYFAIVCDRWMNDENWEHVKRAFFVDIPFPIRGLVTRSVRKQALSALDGQGMARFDNNERTARISKDIAALSVLTEKNAYLFGDTPTAADFSVIAMLGAALGTPLATPMIDLINDNAGLMAYVGRGRQILYGERMEP